MNVWPQPPWGDEMVSLAACLSPPVLGSIGKAIHITDIFLHPPSSHCHPCLLWPGSPANVAIYKNSWDSSADQAFLQHRIDSTGVQKAEGCSQFFCALAKRRKSGRAQSSPLLRWYARLAVSPPNTHRTQAEHTLDAEHVCQPHQQLGPLP